MKALGLLSILLLSSGCATLTTLGNTFEGAADYRIVPAEVACPGGPAVDCKPHPLVAKSVPLSDFTRFQAHPAKVTGEETRFFQKGDFLQVNLKTGIIGWFSEGVEQRLLNELINPISNSRMKGELAIIANVTEKALSPGGMDKDGKLEGRVVFYSGDIYIDQRLNEFNVPIFGPYKYEGGSLSVDLWIMELDRSESEQMGAVLETLTSLSASIPAISSPMIDILGQIGTAFLKSNSDDVIGHIRFTLAPPIGGAKTMDPVLQVSDIIVTRAAKREEQQNFFEECHYHPGSGRVTATKEENSVACAARSESGDNNIFVLGIRKVPEGADISSQVTLADLTERLSAINNTTDLNKAIELIGDEARSAGAYATSIDALDRLRGTPTSAVRDLAADTILKELQCTLLAARFDGKDVQKAVCGERASQRAMSVEDFAKLSKHLMDRLTISSGDLSVDKLLGADVTPDTGADVMRKRRAELYSLFVYKAV